LLRLELFRPALDLLLQIAGEAAEAVDLAKGHGGTGHDGALVRARGDASGFS
jgi:hypothetical protein